MTATNKIRELVSRATPAQIALTKFIFRFTDRDAGSNLEVNYPEWYQAMMKLPDTEAFDHLNNMVCEVSVDILKRAMSEEKISVKGVK